MLRVAVVSSNRLRAHTTRDGPFLGPDEVAGPDVDDSSGSCIASNGGIGTGRTSERIPAIRQVTIPHVKHIT